MKCFKTIVYRYYSFSQKYLIKMFLEQTTPFRLFDISKRIIQYSNLCNSFTCNYYDLDSLEESLINKNITNNIVSICEHIKDKKYNAVMLTDLYRSNDLKNYLLKLVRSIVTSNAELIYISDKIEIRNGKTIKQIKKDVVDLIDNLDEFDYDVQLLSISEKPFRKYLFYIPIYLFISILDIGNSFTNLGRIFIYKPKNYFDLEEGQLFFILAKKRM